MSRKIRVLFQEWLFRPATPDSSNVVGPVGPVRAAAAVAGDLSADCASVTAKPPSDGDVSLATNDPRRISSRSGNANGQAGMIKTSIGQGLCVDSGIIAAITP